MVGLLRVEDWRVPVVIAAAYWLPDGDSPIHELVGPLESPRVTGEKCSPFNSPVWPAQKSDGDWETVVA